MGVKSETSVVIAGAGPLGLGLACERIRGAAAPRSAQKRSAALAISEH
jgi:threonine dehydrogenase-like Zn-dependent dehydrogenase